MALAVAGLETMTLLPALGAAVLLPSAVASAFRLEEDDSRDAGTLPPAVDALLQRVIDGDLDLSADLALDMPQRLPVGFRNGQTAGPTTRATTSGYNDDDDDGEGQESKPGLDTWSVVWYCGMFAAFTSLFLIMPCSQVLCRAGLLSGHGDPRLRPRAPLGAFHTATQGYATPPPPYKQFAPPAYEDVILDLGWTPPGKAVPVEVAEKNKEAASLDVYVIPLRPETAATSTQAAA